MTDKQRDVFLACEGDAWFQRNEAALATRDWSRDPVCARLARLDGGPFKVLEIGCGDGSRLAYLRQQGHDVWGIDPSARAVARAAERGVRAERSTADRLPYGDGSFDVVMFGFCLYLCDDDDLFAIAREAHRVLAARGWLFIMDFEKPTPTYSDYRHRPGVRTRKMDYKTMFLWHPAYTLASHEKLHHETLQWTDDPDQWVSVACLRKCPPPSPSE